MKQRIISEWDGFITENSDFLAASGTSPWWHKKWRYRDPFVEFPWYLAGIFHFKSSLRASLALR
jgi:hypothetical protein